MSGWIKLHREINSHWVWSNSEYLKWWIDILIEANHAPAKVLIKGKLYECNRGEKLYSLDTWAKRWGTNKSKVKRFFDLLQNDKMIVYKSETQTTRITICKYTSYQGNESESETQTKRKRNASETQVKPIKEEQEKEEEEEEKKNKDTLLSEIKISDVDDDLKQFYEIAFNFQQLFIKNLKEKNAPTKSQENAKFKKYVDPIRLMITQNECTIENLREVYAYLNSPRGEFWKTNILSTETLRKQITKLVMSAKMPEFKPKKEDRL